MKSILKCIVLSLILLSIGSRAAAQRSSFDISLGWGGFPLLEEVFFTPREGEIHSMDNLSSMYMDSKGALRCTGSIAIQADAPIAKWFAIPITIAGNIGMRRDTSMITGKDFLSTFGTTQIMAGAKFRYINRPRFNFYTTIHGGIGISFDNEADFYPAVQLVPVGIRMGGKVYGTAEIGIGTMYAGGMIGIGIRL